MTHSHQATSATKTFLLTNLFALCLKLDNFATKTETLSHDLSLSKDQYAVSSMFNPPAAETLRLSSLTELTSYSDHSVINSPSLPRPKPLINTLNFWSLQAARFPLWGNGSERDWACPILVIPSMLYSVPLLYSRSRDKSGETRAAGIW